MVKAELSREALNLEAVTVVAFLLHALLESSDMLRLATIVLIDDWFI